MFIVCLLWFQVNSNFLLRKFVFIFVVLGIFSILRSFAFTKKNLVILLLGPILSLGLIELICLIKAYFIRDLHL